MEKVKRFLVRAGLMVMLCFLCAPFAFALASAESTEDIFYYEDGSYMTVQIVAYSSVVDRTTNRISGAKTNNYYNSNDELMWTFEVHGTFVYNGTSSYATDAFYGYDVYDTAWSFKNATASYSGNTATATGKFLNGLLLTRSTTVSLSCAPDGTLY